MAEIRFPDIGGTKDAFYTLNCSNVTPTFEVSSDATSWLFIDRHEPSRNKLVLSANTNVSVSATPERTGYIIATVNGHTCDQKKLTVTQDAGGGGGSCQCTDVIYSDESFTWDGTTGRNKTLELSLRQGIMTCPVQDLNYSFKLSSNHFSGVVTSDYTLSVGLKGSAPSESQQFNDILVVSFNIGQPSEKIPCTKEIPLSWTNPTCDCSSAPTLTYNGQTLQEPLTWDNDDTNTRRVDLSLGNCTINNIRARIKEETLREYFGITGSTLGAESSIVLGPHDTHTPSEDINATVQYQYKVNNTTDCTDWREFAIKWKGAQQPTCDCNGVAYSKESLHWDSGTDPQEVIITPPAGCEISDLDWEWLESGECFLAEKEGTNKLKVTPIASVTCADKLNISFKLNNNTICNDKEIRVTFGQSTNRSAVVWNENTTLNSAGSIRSLVGTFSSDDPLFDINELVVNTPDWITPEVEETSTGEGNIYFTYGYTPISRLATAGVTYRRAASDNGQKDFPQEGDPYQTGLAFAITKAELNVCGGIEDKIGEYYYTDNFTYVQNTSFTCTTKPNWVSSVTFGIPDPSTKTGEIYATYGRNSGSATRNWEGITITYSGYQDVMPRGETTMSQDIVTASVGACGDAVNPGTAPTTCGEANFYHFDNPYVPGDLSYYYLEHNLSAYEQEYELGTSADFCQYIERDYGGYTTRIPISAIEDPIWEDVRVEIYDVVPNIIHNSACGLHSVEVHSGETFATIKERHTSGNSKSTCACPCYFDGWNPNNGAYEINGYETTSEPLAVFENGELVTEETSEAYDTFWIKVKDASHSIRECYGGGCKYRSIIFSVDGNTGAGAFDRCAIIKIYPNIGGKYCTEECQDCERTAKCYGNKNCCVTDMVVQESVNCANPEEYFNPNHAFSNNYIKSNWGEALTNQMIYDYWWGPCNDTEPYINAVDVYDALVTVTHDGNVRHTQTVGEYLGTVCANGVTPSSDRTTFTSDACISGISITSEYDSDDKLYRGCVRVTTHPYTPEGIGEYDDDMRYRTRILVLYHSGVDYEGWPFISEVEGTNRGEEYYDYYGPKRLNQKCYGKDCTPSYDGIDNGIFCVIEQDGFKPNS